MSSWARPRSQIKITKKPPVLFQPSPVDSKSEKLTFVETTFDKDLTKRQELLKIKEYTIGIGLLNIEEIKLPFECQIFSETETTISAKNRCLANLQSCDYIFLISEDLPERENWWKNIIDKAIRQGSHYISEKIENSHIQFFSQICITRCGGLNQYDDYNQRVLINKLVKPESYIQPIFSYSLYQRKVYTIVFFDKEIHSIKIFDQWLFQNSEPCIIFHNGLIDMKNNKDVIFIYKTTEKWQSIQSFFIENRDYIIGINLIDFNCGVNFSNITSLSMGSINDVNVPSVFLYLPNNYILSLCGIMLYKKNDVRIAVSDLISEHKSIDIAPVIINWNQYVKECGDKISNEVDALLHSNSLSAGIFLSYSNLFDKDKLISTIIKNINNPYWNVTKKSGFWLSSTAIDCLKGKIPNDIFKFLDIPKNKQITVDFESLIKQEKTIIHVYPNNFINTVTPPGLGDFLRGSIFLAQYAEKHKFLFKIDLSNHPLSKYLDEDSVPNLLQPREFNTDYDNINLINLLDNFVDSNDKEIVLNTNVFYNKQHLTEKIKDYIKSKLKFKQKYYDLEKKLVVYDKYDIIHVRCNDAFFVTNFDSDKLYVEILKKFKNHTNKIIVMSNNYYIKKKIKELFGFEYIHTKSVHTANVKKSDDLEGTVIDFIALTKAEKIYTYSFYQHGSGFSEQSAKLYDIPHEKMFISKTKILSDTNTEADLKDSKMWMEFLDKKNLL